MKKRTLTKKELADILARASVSAEEPVQAIEFTAAELDFGMEIDLGLDIDFNAPPPVPTRSGTPLERTPCSGTRKISIRVSNAVLNAFQDQAKCLGTRGQTLINRVLKKASKGW